LCRTGNAGRAPFLPEQEKKGGEREKKEEIGRGGEKRGEGEGRIEKGGKGKKKKKEKKKGGNKGKFR